MVLLFSSLLKSWLEPNLYSLSWHVTNSVVLSDSLVIVSLMHFIMDKQISDLGFIFFVLFRKGFTAHAVLTIVQTIMG